MSEKKNPDNRISNIAPFGLRMPGDLKDRIQKSAAKNNRSMNAEIVFLLDFALDYFDQASVPFPTDIEVEAFRNQVDAKAALGIATTVNPNWAQDIAELASEIKRLRTDILDLRPGGGQIGGRVTKDEADKR